MSRSALRQGCEYLIQVLVISGVLCLAVDATPSGYGGDDQTLYEPNDIETVSGEIALVRTVPRAGGGGRNTTIVLRTSIGDEVQVAIAPQWAVKASGLRLRYGDDVHVTGWRIVRGKPALLAAEIRKDEAVFVFRDRHGMPLWGPRRRLDRRR